MDDFDWWKKRVNELAGKKKEIKRMYDIVKEKLPASQLYTKRDSWVFMKLVILAYYIPIYTNIMRKWRENMIYIDLFSGPGFNYIKSIDEIIAGSPLLAHLMPRTTKKGRSNAFDDLVLFDKNPLYCETLQKVLPYATVTCCDCNAPETISVIKKKLRPFHKSHFLAFIDPEGLQTNWNTLEGLLKSNGDLIINYMYLGVGRNFGSYHKTSGKRKEGMERKLTTFFGDDSWKRIPSDGNKSANLLQLYLNKLYEYRKFLLVIPIISGIGGFQYRIIMAIRDTPAGSPWMKAMEDVKKRIENMTVDQFNRLMLVYRGKQSTLDQFF